MVLPPGVVEKLPIACSPRPLPHLPHLSVHGCLQPLLRKLRNRLNQILPAAFCENREIDSITPLSLDSFPPPSNSPKISILVG